MVYLQEKRKMMHFIADLIAKNKNREILDAEPNHILAKSVITGKELYIFLLNDKRTTEIEFNSQMHDCINKNQVMLNIFYKDGETFQVRLGWKANFKGDDRSLKKYKKEDLDKMLSLRILEKRVLCFQNFNQLSYYQPETMKLEESIRSYNMIDVRFDYSHLDCEDPRKEFAEQNKHSKNYKIAEELSAIVKGELRLIQPSKHFLVIDSFRANETAEKKKKERRTTLF